MIADFNRDGSPDAAFPVGTNDTVGLGLGDKTGNLYLGGVFFPGPGPVSVIAADFDQNGTPDLAVADVNGGMVALLPGDGYGSFWGPMLFFAGADWPNTIVGADFNRDGKDDVAVLDLVSLNTARMGKVAVLLGDGTGSFSEPLITTEVLNTSPNNPVIGREMMAVGDFNHDAIPDIALVEGASNTVAVLVGKGNGQMKLANRLWVGKGPFVVRVGDFNNDGKDDIAVGNYGSSNISILLRGNSQNTQ